MPESNSIRLFVLKDENSRHIRIKLTQEEKKIKLLRSKIKSKCEIKSDFEILTDSSNKYSIQFMVKDNDDVCDLEDGTKLIIQYQSKSSETQPINHPISNKNSSSSSTNNSLPPPHHQQINSLPLHHHQQINSVQQPTQVQQPTTAATKAIEKSYLLMDRDERKEFSYNFCIFFFF